MLHFKNAIQSIPISPLRDIGERIYRERSRYLTGLVDAVELVRQ